MSRRISILFLFIANLLLVQPAMSATGTSGAPTQDAKSKQIEDLKERLATKAAQLRQSQKKAIYGTVKSTTISSIVVETPTKNIKIELADDIKVFQNLKSKRTKLTTEDIAKDDLVTVFGDLDTTLDILSARVVFIQNPPQELISGTITDISTKEYAVTLKTHEGRSAIIDIEKYTKTFHWSKEKSLEKSGFSKLSLGETVHAVGLPIPKKENRISAYRIISLGKLSGETSTQTQEPSPSSVVTTQE